MLGADVRLDLLDRFGERGIGLHLLFHLLNGVQHSGVVPVAEELADIVTGEVGHAADQVHGYLPGGHGLPHPGPPAS